MSKHLGQHGGYKLTVYISLLHFKAFHFFRTSLCGLNVGPTTGLCPRCIYLFFSFSLQAIPETDEQQPMLPDLDEVPAPIF